MGALRVTPQEIVEMHRLYAEPVNYAAVGRKIWRSGSAAAKHIKMKGAPDIAKRTYKEIVRE